jgi:hypothetical protein
MKILVSLITFILLTNLLQAAALDRSDPLQGDCDSLLFTNGKWIAVRNLQ